ncbi:hypothetical protein [Alicyclobacillus hesperidum]|uniref:hypothetical protein n=1 Tax=Alicyclobacillus hesperidum TaxID=89784 RepID=UPI0002F866A4|nr:hypothetical protein [Alicyclobacillus hesperidum]
MSEQDLPIRMRQVFQPLHPAWGIPLRDLRRSLYAEQIMSALIDELQVCEHSAKITAKLGLIQQETSRMRGVAIGHCIRLHFIPDEASTEQERTRQLLLIAMRRADEADEHAERELTGLRKPYVEAEWLRSLGLWHRERRRWLHKALAALAREEE